MEIEKEKQLLVAFKFQSKAHACVYTIDKWSAEEKHYQEHHIHVSLTSKAHN